MHSLEATLDGVRKHAEELLKTIGVSRIIVVDDEYAEYEVEELLGICSEVASEPETLPHLDDVDFTTDREIWTDRVRQRWETLDNNSRRELVASARGRASKSVGSGPVTDGKTDDAPEQLDTRAAQSLEKLLDEIEDCEYITLSLSQWNAQADAFLGDDRAASTVLLFDRDFSREEEGTENQGIRLLRRVQSTNVGYCGLMTHTVQVGSEYDVWSRLTVEYDLDRDKFVVIAKERLTDDLPDYYQFLRMLRFVALNGRYAIVKSTAWSIFEQSVTEAKAAVEDLSVLDFDRIVFGSSRREGVWEPDTLFRVFEILMRREARSRLHRTEDICAAVVTARRTSNISEELAAALGEERASQEALRIQRFEIYDLEDDLNPFHVPIEIGDVFERKSTGRLFILLAQPCDLMVRRGGMRNYDDDRHGRTGALLEVVAGGEDKQVKDSWEELPYYHEKTGRPAFADLAKVHQVRLAVLDLCAFQADGVAAVDVNAACPDLLIEPWKMRYQRLQKFFDSALKQYKQLEDNPRCNALKSLALPVASATARLPATVDGHTLRYDLKRVMRLRQPRSGALLTALTQHQARAAFEHPFDYRVPTQSALNGNQDFDHDREPGTTK